MAGRPPPQPWAPSDTPDDTAGGRPAPEVRRAVLSGPAPLRTGLRRLENRIFPPRTSRPADKSGLLPGWPPEWYALTLAALIAGIFATFLELAVSMNPVPPGGDPGEWLTTSYAYVGLPFPTWIIPGQYPPLLFPLLGSLVHIGGGPLGGAKLYLGLVSVLVGLSTYMLARSLVRLPIIALVAEALVLFNPSFMQLFFFGAYPNLLGLVFFNLCLAFLIRYVRSARPLYVFLFWTFLTAAILTHSLVGAILGVTVGVILIFLVWMGRVPSSAYRSRAGFAGIMVLIVGVGGFYAATHFLGIPHPNYLQTNAFAYVKNGLGQIFYLLLNPYFPGVRPSVTAALPLLVVISGLIVVVLVGMRLFVPERLSLAVLTVLAMILAVTSLCVVGWELSIVTDYVRLGYFLVTPFILGIIVLLDGIMAAIRQRAATGPPSAPSPSEVPVGIGVEAAPEHGTGAPAAVGYRSRGAPGAFPTFVILALLVAGLILFVNAFSIPAFAREEEDNTSTGHDQLFLNAIHSIRTSGVSGNVLTVPGAAKWTRALLAVNAYAPILPARYSFDPTHILVQELAYFAMTDRFAVTNGNVAVASSGLNPAFNNQSPMYEAAFFGVFTPVLTMPSPNMTVVLVNGTHYVNERLTQAPTIYGPLLGQPEAMAIVYNGPGYSVNITVSTVPGTVHAVTSVRAVATGTLPLAYLNATIFNPVNGSSRFAVSGYRGGFLAIPSQYGSVLATYGNVTPAAGLTGVIKYNHLGVPAQVDVSIPASVPRVGANNLSFSIAYSTPAAVNLVTTLPPFISTTQWWATWNMRFVLYANASTPSQARANFLLDEVQYLVGEFGAQVYAVSGPWTVLILPPYN
ncbi:MAG TPA: hypothetical protein VGV89_03410 [Thermoplasmata archaeon]|nr:hypothetical protein [Thermoplasmata archaeon]